MQDKFIALLLILASRIIYRFEGVCVKKYNEKHGKGGFIFNAIFTLTAMAFFLFKGLVVDKSVLSFNSLSILLGAICGLAFASAVFLTYLAYGSGSFVLTSLILSYGIIINIVYGIWLGETISILGWIAIALIIFSLYFVKGNGKGESIKISKKWVICAGLSVIFAGVFSVLQAHQQLVFNNTKDNEFMIVTYAVATLCLLVVGLIKNGKDLKYTLKHGTLYGVGAGFVNGMVNLLVLYTYMFADKHFIAPISAGISIIVSFVIAKIIFKEKFSKMQYLGVILGGLAIILFNL